MKDREESGKHLRITGVPLSPALGHTACDAKSHIVFLSSNVSRGLFTISKTSMNVTVRCMMTSGMEQKNLPFYVLNKAYKDNNNKEPWHPLCKKQLLGHRPFMELECSCLAHFQRLTIVFSTRLHARETTPDNYRSFQQRTSVGIHFLQLWVSTEDGAK